MGRSHPPEGNRYHLQLLWSAEFGMLNSMIPLLGRKFFLNVFIRAFNCRKQKPTLAELSRKDFESLKKKPEL